MGEMAPQSRRRPRDYFQLLGGCSRLGKARQADLRKAIRNHYAGRVRSAVLADECTQEAMLILWSYGSDLNLGPPIVGEPDEGWYKLVHEALLRFATGGVVRAAVLRVVYESLGEETTSDGDEEAGIPDPGGDAGMNWSESYEYFVQVFKDFRIFVSGQPDVDPLELKVLDQLLENAIRDATDKTMAEVFRGENLQIVHETLLLSLKRTWPGEKWTIEDLRVLIAKIRRHAAQHEARKT